MFLSSLPWSPCSRRESALVAAGVDADSVDR
jgi:hypothetical protein